MPLQTKVQQKSTMFVKKKQLDFVFKFSSESKRRMILDCKTATRYTNEKNRRRPNFQLEGIMENCRGHWGLASDLYGLAQRTKCMWAKPLIPPLILISDLRKMKLPVSLSLPISEKRRTCLFFGLGKKGQVWVDLKLSLQV